METLLIAVLISIALTIMLTGRRSQPPSPTVIYLPSPTMAPQGASMGCLPLIIGAFIFLILLRLLAG